MAQTISNLSVGAKVKDSNNNIFKIIGKSSSTINLLDTNRYKRRV